MDECRRRRAASVIALVVALAGLALFLLGPSPGARAQTSRTVQVWPDRSVGVASGRLEGLGGHSDARVFPFGDTRVPSGETVSARTYLHFPLAVFPPGTDVVNATLYVYVDAGLGAGEGAFGAYRVVEPWGEEGWGGDPATWPALGDAPIAVATHAASTGAPASSGGGRALAAHSMPVAGAGSALAGSTLLTGTLTPTLTLTPTPTSTPTLTPTPSVTPTPEDSPLVSATPDDSPLPTPDSPLATATLPAATEEPAPDAPIVELEEVEGRWLSWNVTPLLQAWLEGEAPDHGLALAFAPGVGGEGERLVARWLSAGDPETRPYLIVDTVVYPVTATPVPSPTPVPVLPAAGGAGGGAAAGVLLAGLAALAAALAVRRGRQDRDADER